MSTQTHRVPCTCGRLLEIKVTIVGTGPAKVAMTEHRHKEPTRD